MEEGNRVEEEVWRRGKQWARMSLIFSCSLFPTFFFKEEWEEERRVAEEVHPAILLPDSQHKPIPVYLKVSPIYLNRIDKLCPWV